MNGELYPGEFEAMERQGRLDAVIPEQKMMTREEAIEELSILLNKYQDGNFGDALDMAIVALEKCDKIEKIIDSNDADFIANYVKGLFAE